MTTAKDYGPNFEKWDALFRQCAGECAIDWKILKAICMNESSLGLDTRVECGLREPSNIEGSKSRDGLSWGLFQLRPSTAKDYDPEATPEKLNDPLYSSKIAAKHIRRLWLTFSGDEHSVVRAYNCGAHGVKESPKAGQDYLNKYLLHRSLLDEPRTDIEYFKSKN